MFVQITGYYSAPSEIELIGTADAWRSLATIIASVSQPENLALYIKEGGPEPFTSFITNMLIIPEGEKVEIKLEDSTLYISGARANLEQLAVSFQWLADNPQPSNGISQHLHIEYVAEPSYLSPLALPIVATVMDG
jgi:hypothetical protein